jgi:hypothetical protein
MCCRSFEHAGNAGTKKTAREAKAAAVQNANGQPQEKHQTAGARKMSQKKVDS